MNIGDAIKEAQSVMVPRSESYGTPWESFGRAVEILKQTAPHLTLARSDLALIMHAVKLSRNSYAYKRDNTVDSINYLDFYTAFKERENTDALKEVFAYSPDETLPSEIKPGRLIRLPMSMWGKPMSRVEELMRKGLEAEKLNEGITKIKIVSGPRLDWGASAEATIVNRIKAAMYAANKIDNRDPKSKRRALLKEVSGNLNRALQIIERYQNAPKTTQEEHIANDAERVIDGGTTDVRSPYVAFVCTFTGNYGISARVVRRINNVSLSSATKEAVKKLFDKIEQETKATGSLKDCLTEITGWSVLTPEAKRDIDTAANIVFDRKPDLARKLWKLGT